MASKQCSFWRWLSRITGQGMRQYERIKKHEQQEVVSEEEDEISSAPAVKYRKVRHLFKLSKRKARSRRSRRRVRIRFVLGMRRRLRWATLLQQLKVSWRRFAKVVKDSQPHFADLSAGNHLFLHLTPPPPIWWYNHLEARVGGHRNIGHPRSMLYIL